VSTARSAARPGASGPSREESPRSQASLRVGLLYNLTSSAPAPPPGAPRDYFYELDSEDYVESWRAALEAGGHLVFLMEGNADLLQRLRQTPVDICFNTCEGFRGDAREAQVPALLEMLGVPYSGSRVLTLALTLDKPMTQRVLSFHGLPTPPFQEFRSADDPLDPRLRFPLFAKPAREGSGIGIGRESIVRTEKDLRARVDYLLRGYREPALVEEFIEGPDVTLGLVGNWPELHVFPPSSVDYSAYGPGTVPVYGSEFKVDRADEYQYQCPAPLPTAVAEELNRLAVAAVRATGTLDFARVDFRLSEREGKRPYILEVNALPGVSPVSDLTLMAEADGWTHLELVNAILNAALARWGIRPATSGQKMGASSQLTGELV